MGTVKALDAAIRAVCPIHGVNSDRIVHFKPEATQGQKDAGQAIADGWDFDTPDTDEVADKQGIEYAKADAVIQYLVAHTPAECEAWVNANVNNLADAKNFLGKVAIALCILARRELR